MGKKKDNKEVGCCLVDFRKINPFQSDVTTNIHPSRTSDAYCLSQPVRKSHQRKLDATLCCLWSVQCYQTVDYFNRTTVYLVMCFVCHPHFWPSCFFFSEMFHVILPPLHLTQQTDFVKKQCGSKYLAPFINTQLTVGRTLCSGYSGGWVRFTVSLPGNVSCCETMWQKISTAVMAQQCSLPLYILLQELIQSPPQMYCM